MIRHWMKTPVATVNRSDLLRIMATLRYLVDHACNRREQLLANANAV